MLQFLSEIILVLFQFGLALLAALLFVFGLTKSP